ncbi:hypothetical protein [Streptomyces sp. G1]|uniref:hypothetical protein n=1 Tax=Streptomyces sp. G1 TaxID=361572 RepID=UPI0020301C2F|nr:hypothetical protein [Streptomyces sp. G1]MCM1969906.1 hypothetical protein [Streptomyces sp. G1]
MDLRGRKLKFTAVAVLVVLSLTGFSSGRGHGGSGDGDSGGGCSSSSQNHDSSSNRHDDDDDNDTSGSGGSGPGADSGSAGTAQDVTIDLVSCASTEQPYAVVDLTNPNADPATVTVVVHFKDAQSSVVDMQTVEEIVPAGETAQVQVDLTDASHAAQVDLCEAELMPTV